MAEITIAQAARLMNVSVRSVYLAGELQRCSPELAARVEAGELSIRAALRIAKPEKYGKRDKVEQWLASYRAWDSDTRLRALGNLIQWEDQHG